MAKDTKTIITSTLLKIISEKGKLTISEIYKQSFISRATIMNNFPGGVNEIIEYIYFEVMKEIIHVLKQYDPDNLPLEQLADIVLPILWKNRKTAYILFNSSVPFRPTSSTSDEIWPWVEKRYNSLVKTLGLSPLFSGKELHQYWNDHLLAIFTLWLSSESPLEPDEFRSIFLFLARTSINDLIYYGIN